MKQEFKLIVNAAKAAVDAALAISEENAVYTIRRAYSESIRNFYRFEMQNVKCTSTVDVCVIGYSEACKITNLAILGECASQYEWNDDLEAKCKHFLELSYGEFLRDFMVAEADAAFSFAQYVDGKIKLEEARDILIEYFKVAQWEQEDIDGGIALRSLMSMHPNVECCKAKDLWDIAWTGYVNPKEEQKQKTSEELKGKKKGNAKEQQEIMGSKINGDFNEPFALPDGDF